MSDTWTLGQRPDTRRIRVQYATWRIVNHIVGQRFRTRLGHVLIVLINDFNSQQRKKEDGEKRWEADGVLSDWFQKMTG